MQITLLITKRLIKLLMCHRITKRVAKTRHLQNEAFLVMIKPKSLINYKFKYNIHSLIKRKMQLFRRMLNGIKALNQHKKKFGAGKHHHKSMPKVFRLQPSHLKMLLSWRMKKQSCLKLHSSAKFHQPRPLKDAKTLCSHHNSK